MYIVLISGFRGTHRPPAQPSHGIEDKASDANDEGDFDIPRYAQCCRDSCPICLLDMMNRKDLHLSNLVRFHFNGYTYHILCICSVYEMYIHCISYVYVNDRAGILRVYTPCSISCIEN